MESPPEHRIVKKGLGEAWKKLATEIGADCSWDEFTESDDTEVLLGKVLANDFEGWPISLTYRQETSWHRAEWGSRTSSTKSRILMTAHHQSKDEFSFSIQRKSALRKLLKFAVKRGVDLGYADIDREFRVFSNDKRRLRALFANKKIRRLVHHLPSTTLQRKPRLTTGALLGFTTKDSVTDTEQIRSLFQLFAQILNGLRRMGLAEREE